MRSLLLSRRLVVVLLAGALLSFACNGGGGDFVPFDIDDVPTATPPAVLPDTVIVAESDVPISGATYAVQPGDTLLAIADTFGTTVDTIVNANDLTDAASLEVGQLLVIPGLPNDDTPEPSATAEPDEPTDMPEPTDEPDDPTDTPEPMDEPEPEATDEPSAECEGNVHILEEGEFPAVIAPLYDITLEELMAANPGIDPTTLQIGDCLIIPEPSA